MIKQRSWEPRTVTYRQHKVVCPWLGLKLQCISQHNTESAHYPTMPMPVRHKTEITENISCAEFKPK